MSNSVELAQAAAAILAPAAVAFGSGTMSAIAGDAVDSAKSMLGRLRRNELIATDVPSEQELVEALQAEIVVDREFEAEVLKFVRLVQHSSTTTNNTTVGTISGGVNVINPSGPVNVDVDNHY